MVRRAAARESVSYLLEHLTQLHPPTINITSMPTYQYVCEKCGHQFDQFQPISAKPLTICPEKLCARKRWGKGKVKRAIARGRA